MGTEDHQPDGRSLTRRELRARRTATTAASGDPAAAATASPPSPLGSLFAAAAAPMPRDADVDPTPTILVVCTGNICRSPLGELLLSSALDRFGVRVHSAGTAALVGHGMPSEARRVAREHGISAEDAASHVARALTDDMVARADITLTMTGEHRTRVIDRVPGALRRVFTMREFAALARTVTGMLPVDAAASPRARLATAVAQVAAHRGGVPTGDEFDDVIDPYRRSAATYDRSAAQLVPAVDEVVRVVQTALAASRS